MVISFNYQTQGNGKFSGQIDEVVIYDTALSASDILAFYQGSAASLESGSDYYWRIQYQDNTGLWSDFSTEISFTTP